MSEMIMSGLTTAEIMAHDAILERAAGKAEPQLFGRAETALYEYLRMTKATTFSKLSFLHDIELLLLKFVTQRAAEEGVVLTEALYSRMMLCPNKCDSCEKTFADCKSTPVLAADQFPEIMGTARDKVVECASWEQRKARTVEAILKTQQPAEAASPHRTERKAEVLERSCLACGKCAEVCPKEAISFGGTGTGYKSAVIDKVLCIGCGKCSDDCPGDAIIFSDGGAK